MKQTYKTYRKLIKPIVRRLLALFLLTASVTGVWGQKVADGIYYIRNNATNQGYLWPSVTTNSSGYRYLTTSLDVTADAVTNNNGVTYPAHDKSYSHWVVKNVTGECIQLINPRLNKYVVIRKFPKADNTKENTYGDRDVWLTDKPATEDIEYTYFVLNNNDSPYKISPKAGLNGVNSTSTYSLNSASGDDRTWLTWSKSDIKPQNGEGREGLIQFYSGGTPLWSFTSDLLDAPTISDVDESTNTFTIEDANNLPLGYTIRYTTDGTTTPTATTGTEYTGPVTVTGNWTVMAVVVRYGIVLTAVASKALEPAPCATPVITYDNTTSKISITCATVGSTIHYTTNGSNPTASSAEYSEPFYFNSTATVKAIATNTESGFRDSEIASVRIVLDPKITLAQTEYTYNGSAIEPEVSSVMDGEDEIPASEYEISYSDNNINVGTATINIVDKAGGAYIVYGSTTFTIVPAGVTLTANSGTETYDGTEKTVTGFTTSVDGLTFEGVSASGSGTNAGTYDVTLTGVTVNTTKDTSGNYVVTGTTNGTLTINKKALTITANPKTIIYGNGPTNDGVTYSGFATGEDKNVLSGTLAYAYNYTKYGDVGSYTITPSGLTGTNYNISFVAGTLTVAHREVGLIWSETTTFTYDGASHGLTATATELVNSDVIAVNVTGAQTDAGDHTATASSLTGEKAGNYKLPTENTHAFTITPVGLTVTAKDNSITYGADLAGNGVTYEGFVGEDDENDLSGTLDYDYSYTQFGDVGDYTITPKGLTSDNYDITFVKGKLTVNAKEVGIEWTNIALTYNGEEQVPTATATGMVNGDEIAVTVTGGKTNAGNYTATASSLTGDKAGNYKLPEANTQSFTISQKSIGNGSTISAGYTLDFGEGNTILLTDEDIGRTMVITTDYVVSDDLGPTNDNYSLRNVVGNGNYTGSFNVRNVVISFTTDTDQEEWSATLAAENTEGFDIGIGLALPEGVSAFIISGIQGEWAIPEPLNYIPAGVPVLLVAHKPIYGFVPIIAESGDVTQNQKDRNMLEKVTESTADYDTDTESAHFATKQIYLLYKNEFVFNKDGNLKKGKVYLNPNHTAPSAEPAPAHLKIAWNFTTGLEDGKWKTEDGRNERWYTLDGRRLSCKPTAKGLYIVDGKKVVIK